MSKTTDAVGTNRVAQHLNGSAQETISLPQLQIQHLSITLIGDSPLICHAWDEKAKRQMLDKQMKKAKRGKDAKDPEQDFFNSLYWLTPKPEKPQASDIAKARYGFPAVAFKSAAVDACRHVDGMKMTGARGSFHIIGDMVEIIGTPTPREDMVRVGMGTADIRYRGEFRSWKAKVAIRYNATVFSPEQIVNLFNVAGFAVGIGEWRPEKSGSFGMFHVLTEGE